MKSEPAEFVKFKFEFRSPISGDEEAIPFFRKNREAEKWMREREREREGEGEEEEEEETKRAGGRGTG